MSEAVLEDDARPEPIERDSDRDVAWTFSTLGPCYACRRSQRRRAQRRFRH